MSMRVRSLTLHIPLGPGEVKDPAGLLQDAAKKLAVLREALRRSGIGVWSLRVSLAPAERLPSLSTLRGIVSAASPYGEGLLVAAMHTLPHPDNLDKIAAVLPEAGNLYSSILVEAPSDSFKGIHRLLLRLKAHASRLAIIFGGFIQTPYFPAACSLRDEECVSASLLYPSIIEREGPRGLRRVAEAAQVVEEVLREAAEGIGVAYCGIDASLSPWMEESATEALEAYAGSKLYTYGFIHHVRSFNEALESTICRSVTCIGFNEAMLPVAEDNKLKDYVRSGLVDLETLLHLVYGCIAGLDMVAVEEPPPGLLLGLMLEVQAASRIKGRVTGLRVMYAERGKRKLFIDKTLGSTPLLPYSMERIPKPWRPHPPS